MIICAIDRHLKTNQIECNSLKTKLLRQSTLFYNFNIIFNDFPIFVINFKSYSFNI